MLSAVSMRHILLGLDKVSRAMEALPLDIRLNHDVAAATGTLDFVRSELLDAIITDVVVESMGAV